MTRERPATYKMKINSNPSELQEPRQWLISQLSEFDYSQEDIFAIRLALEEAFYNAVKHGNKMDISKKVDINFTVKPNEVEMIMSDSGGGFNPNAVPDCRLEQNLYKTEGRGLLLIRSYMDVVEYNKLGNSVRMVRYKHPQKQASESAPKS